ncbi:MAG: class I mannose-6-phosphate isomerase [Bacteroidaceae bacterium]|nr:class I mannose-6-phosphate isomerase [Bacteroidaceae bacterium]
MYILKFKPRFVEKPWGGQTIKTVRGDVPADLKNVGELWSISAVHGDVTEVANGYLAGMGLDELCLRYGATILGAHVQSKFGEFPMLVKLIDAAENLSVQVHPNDEQARRIQGVSDHSRNVFGKTEMWYILRRAEGASLIDGFERALPAEEYRQRVADNTIMDYLHDQPVEPGEVYFIPSGRVHGIGAGVFLAEVQQSSDITYRIYDYGRPRELHTEQAAQVIDFSAVENPRTDYTLTDGRLTNVVESRYFSTSLMSLSSPADLALSQYDSFSIVMCTRGRLTITARGLQGQDAEYASMTLNTYECCLIPADIASVTVTPQTTEAQLLHTYMP